MRVTVSPYKKFHTSMIPTTAKATGNYLNSILAVREAASRGYDEAILLDMHGNLAEGAVENIFLVRNGRLLTNDRNSSILPRHHARFGDEDSRATWVTKSKSRAETRRVARR